MTLRPERPAQYVAEKDIYDANAGPVTAFAPMVMRIVNAAVEKVIYMTIMACMTMMIDPIALHFAGITPPPPGSCKTTCPICSPRRVKHWERCMSVRPMGDVIEVHCWHCGYEREVNV